MNKTVIALAFIGIATVGFIGVILIAWLRPDALGSIIAFVGALLGTIITSIVTFSALGTITKNTNGRLTQLSEHRDALMLQVAQQGVTPVAEPAKADEA